MDCPEIVLSPIQVYAGPAGGDLVHCMVTASGPTPDDAVESLRVRAADLGRGIIRRQWDNMTGYNSLRRDWELRSPGGEYYDKVSRTATLKIRADFSLVTVQLASGPVDGRPGWVAYGSLVSSLIGVLPYEPDTSAR
jgi:hypothetical protein